MSRLLKNSNDKYPLIDNKTGNIVEFDYSVDANEALRMKDEKGEHRYSQPEIKKDPLLATKTIKTPVNPDLDVEAMQAEQAEQFESVKVVRKSGRPAKTPKTGE